MANKVATDINEILEKALEEKIGNYEIENHGGNEAGQGYLGEMLFLTVKNKNTGKKLDVIVKQVLTSSVKSTTEFMSSSYLNEIYFYTKVYPTYLEFQKSYPGSKIFFDNVPKCLAVSTEIGKEKLVMENLKVKNYEVHPKKILVTNEMYEEIFKLYGRFHGVSLAFKNIRAEKFLELNASFRNNFMEFMKKDILPNFMKNACRALQAHLETIGEDKILKKFKKYVDNSSQLFIDDVLYKSPFSVILHGDCWSNNLMFKYNESRKIEDIKLIDFQMVSCGSPVLDLTYSFYSGAARETLDKLDHFLRIYHNSLGDTLKQYDCDVEKIFSFDDLKREWKEHNAFGVLMSLLILRNKTDEELELKISEIMDRNVDSKIEKTVEDMYNTDTFKKVGTNLLRHLYVNDFL